LAYASYREFAPWLTYDAAGERAKIETLNIIIIMPKKRFIPGQQAAVLSKAAQMLAALTKTGVVPADYGLTAQDVTELGTILDMAQTASGESNDAREAKKSKTKAFSGSGAALDQLVAQLSDLGNKVRMSDATDDMIQGIGVERRKATPTRKTAPDYPPELSVIGVGYHSVTLRFHDTGSSGGRARAENAIGVQIAVADAAEAVTDDEANFAPIKSASRSPVNLDTTGWPAKVRLYARWETQRKEFSPWSGPQVVSVLSN
jgi:hypothetical protein